MATADDARTGRSTAETVAARRMVIGVTSRGRVRPCHRQMVGVLIGALVLALAGCSGSSGTPGTAAGSLVPSAAPPSAPGSSLVAAGTATARPSVPAVSVTPPEPAVTPTPPEPVVTAPATSRETVTAAVTASRTVSTTTTATVSATATATVSTTTTVNATKTVSSAAEASASGASATASPSGDPAAEGTTSSGLPWWLWALLLAVAAAVVAFVLVRRRNAARTRWEASFVAAHHEALWLSTELLTTLERDHSPYHRRDEWMLTRPRVLALEQSLAPLPGTAPTPQEAAAAGELLGAVRQVRNAVDEVIDGPRPGPNEHRMIVLEAHRFLDDTIRRTTPLATAPSTTTA